MPGKKLITTILLLAGILQGKTQQFTNPILSGFYPDPSICRAGDDYYIVNSSFSYYPGLPIFHSKDLLNWQLIGHAMDRPSQLNLDGAGVSRGLFAPAISFHNGTFYIVCTLIDKLGNFVITANDPKGPWTDPVPLPEVNGIDPSLFFDNNGKAYILFNSIPPGNISLHNGHRTIRMFAFDADKLAVTGPEILLVNGGTDMAKKPVWIEGPHIIQKDSWYYLVCAEGGTGYNHSEVVFRSRDVEGPYVSYEHNPILTQRHLDRARKHPVTTAGHADFVQDREGKWWAIFLGCRPYEGDYYNTGRETFMTPVEWKDDWPVINPGFETVQYAYPNNAIIDKKAERFSGNYFFRDEFEGSELNPRFSFLRTKREHWLDLRSNRGSLALKLRPETVSGTGNPSFVGFRQPHLEGHAATAVRLTAGSGNEKAGLLLFQSEHHFYFLCRSVKDGKEVIELFKGPGNTRKEDTPALIASIPIKIKKGNEIYMKIIAKRDKYDFYYAVRKGEWKLLKGEVDGKFLSTKEAGGFVGCFYAMYATSDGKASVNTAVFDWFEVENKDEVYKRY